MGYWNALKHTGNLAITEWNLEKLEQWAAPKTAIKQVTSFTNQTNKGKCPKKEKSCSLHNPLFTNTMSHQDPDRDQYPRGLLKFVSEPLRSFLPLRGGMSPACVLLPIYSMFPKHVPPLGLAVHHPLTYEKEKRRMLVLGVDGLVRKFL